MVKKRHPFHCLMSRAGCPLCHSTWTPPSCKPRVHNPPRVSRMWLVKGSTLRSQGPPNPPPKPAETARRNKTHCRPSKISHKHLPAKTKDAARPSRSPPRSAGFRARLSGRSWSKQNWMARSCASNLLRSEARTPLTARAGSQRGGFFQPVSPACRLFV